MPTPPIHLTSPGAAFSEQARMETRLDISVTDLASEFLAAVTEAATRTPLAPPGAAFVHDTWTAGVRAASETSLPEYARESFLRSTLPDEVHDTLRAVYEAASVEQWPAGRTRREVRTALSLDTSSSIVTPATPATLTAAGLERAGMSWLARIRRDVRTAATGLFGWTAQGALTLTGIPYKRWVARHDDRTRPTHAEADGQTVPVSSAFLVGGTSLAHPGERGGPAEETVNCRCVMVGVLRASHIVPPLA